MLDADAPPVVKPGCASSRGRADNTPMNFILSDDQPLEQISGENVIYRSLGSQWLQGHMAIAIVHFLLDEGVDINR